MLSESAIFSYQKCVDSSPTPSARIEKSGVLVEYSLNQHTAILSGNCLKFRVAIESR